MISPRGIRPIRVADPPGPVRSLSWIDHTLNQAIFQAMSTVKLYPVEVTDEIREIIREHIAESGLSQAEIARQIGVSPQNLNRALKEQGMVAPIWQRILDFFDLKIIVVRKSKGTISPSPKRD